MSRRSEAKQEAMLREKLGRRQYLNPLLEDDEEIDWEVSCRWFWTERNGHSRPIQEGFLAMTAGRLFLVPMAGFPRYCCLTTSEKRGSSQSDNERRELNYPCNPVNDACC